MSQTENETRGEKTKSFDKQSMIKRVCIFSLVYIGCLLFGCVVIGMEYGFKRDVGDWLFTVAKIQLGPLNGLFPNLLSPTYVPVFIETWYFLICIVIVIGAVLLILLRSYLIRPSIRIDIVVLCFVIIWLLYGTVLFLAQMGI
jgi:magnesium-transporting ATPase (P-type)